MKHKLTARCKVYTKQSELFGRGVCFFCLFVFGVEVCLCCVGIVLGCCAVLCCVLLHCVMLRHVVLYCVGRFVLVCGKLGAAVLQVITQKLLRCVRFDKLCGFGDMPDPSIQTVAQPLHLLCLQHTRPHPVDVALTNTTHIYMYMDTHAHVHIYTCTCAAHANTNTHT